MELLGFSVSLYWSFVVLMEEEDARQQVAEATTGAANSNMEGAVDGGGRDLESNPLNEPLLKRSRTLSSTPLAIVGAKVSHIESLDYE